MWCVSGEKRRKEPRMIECGMVTRHTEAVLFLCRLDYCARLKRLMGRARVPSSIMAKETPPGGGCWVLLWYILPQAISFMAWPSLDYCSFQPGSSWLSTTSTI